MLSLDLTEEETGQLVKAIESSFNDAVYYGRFWEERYSKSLIEKIALALLDEKRAKEEIDSLVGDDFTEEYF